MRHQVSVFASICLMFGALVGLPACKSLDRKYADSSLLIVRSRIELRNKFSLTRGAPAFETLRIVRAPFEENEPIAQNLREGAYYVFADLPAGTYKITSGYYRLARSSTYGPTAAQAALMGAEDHSDASGEGLELGVSVPWEGDMAQLSHTETRPDGIHFMGDFRILLHFAGRASTYPSKMEVSGEKTAAGERAALQFLLRKWPDSPWADLVRSQLAALD